MESLIAQSPTAQKCPSCDQSQSSRLGSVASRNSDHGFFDGGNLFECNVCHLLYLTKGESNEGLAEKYEELPSNLLDEIVGRADFDLALELLSKQPTGKRILDVGCFRGDFLNLLPSTFEKFGIEPSREARVVAEGRRIKLIGDTIEDAVADEGSFDFITMMDVAEHLPRPLDDFRRLARWLKPGGKLIVTTGNAEALPWRLSRLNYYYYLPQHLSFCNPAWFHWVGDQLGMRVIASTPFSHSRRAYGKMFVPERWTQLIKLVVGSMSERITGKRLFPNAAGTATWPDHLFVVYQRS